jgi:transcriptional regulator with XRE-family HTH domain
MLNLARTDARRALSEFVRDRRTRTRPEDVGLTPGGRRRTLGLRREEVAQLAGVGVTWYTWFEQGREIRVSAGFLECICRALRLDPAERAHLFTLAQHRPPPHGATGIPAVSAALKAMLNSLPNPAYVKTARWDVAAWNPAAAAMFGNYALVPPDQRNTLWLAFTDPHYRHMMVDWAEDVRRMLAKFRLDYGRAGDDPGFEELIDKLEEASPEFHQWWPRQDVSGRGEGVKRFRHAKIGEIEFEHTAFIVEGTPDLRLVVYTPVSEEDARRLRKL